MESFDGEASYSYYKIVPIIIAIIGFVVLFIALGIAMLFN